MTNSDTIKFELNKEETKKFYEFKDRVREIKKEELVARKGADIDSDYLSKRSQPSDYNVTIQIVEGYIGYTVYAICETLNLKENITDYSIW